MTSHSPPAADTIQDNTADNVPPCQSPLPAAGIYILELQMPKELHIPVGALGDICFSQATYLYVGSAMKALPHRIARHLHQRKPLHWHIDYLTIHADPLRIWLWPPDRSLECKIAGILNGYMPAVEGFGASDCDCPAHLFVGDGQQPCEALWEPIGAPRCVQQAENVSADP